MTWHVRLFVIFEPQNLKLKSQQAIHHLEVSTAQKLLSEQLLGFSDPEMQSIGTHGNKMDRDILYHIHILDLIAVCGLTIAESGDCCHIRQKQRGSPLP